MKSLKPKSYTGENITDFCAVILVYDECLESTGAFNPDHLGHITRIFEDTSDSIFRLWGIQNYNEVKEFIKKLRVCGMNVISPEELITYESLVQEATHEYCDLVNSKQREPANGKEKSQYQPSLPRAYIVAIGQLVNKALKQVDFKIPRSVNVSGSGGGTSVKSNLTCHKCDKKVYIHKYCRSKGTGYSGNPPKMSTHYLP